MGGKAGSLIGQVFGRLTVQRLLPVAEGDRMWRCICDCGSLKVVSTGRLRAGVVKSCGCLRSSLLTEKNTTHGGSELPEYTVWCGIKQRCNYTGHVHYRRYGGRGITMCQSWEDFSVFLSDMGPRPSDRHSIERANNDGPYAPWNCSWQTAKVQAANTSRNRMLTLGGESKPAKAWAEELGIGYSTLIRRLNSGWPEARALTERIRGQS